MRYGVMVALQILVLSVQVRILVSQRQSSNSMYYTDLGDFSYKTGSETGHLVIAGMSNSFSLYKALMELCKEKKWLFSKRPQAWNIYQPNSPKALNGTHRKDRAEVKYKPFRDIQRKISAASNNAMATEINIHLRADLSSAFLFCS